MGLCASRIDEPSENLNDEINILLNKNIDNFVQANIINGYSLRSLISSIESKLDE